MERRMPKKDGVAHIDRFRPLTDEEKQQFENSLDGSGRRILAELAGKPATYPEQDESDGIIQPTIWRAFCRLPE
jgi:hypothetical protein